MTNTLGATKKIESWGWNWFKMNVTVIGRVRDMLRSISKCNVMEAKERA